MNGENARLLESTATDGRFVKHFSISPIAILPGLLLICVASSVAQTPPPTATASAARGGAADTSAPPLNSGKPAIEYLQRLEPNRRAAYLRGQLAKLPPGPLKTKALEELVWIKRGGADAELAQLRALDAANPSVQIFDVANHIDRMLGRPVAETPAKEVTSVADVLDRWKQATGYSKLLAHSVVFSRTKIQVFGKDFSTDTYCVTNGAALRTESIYEDYYLAVKGTAAQIYNPAQSNNITGGTFSASDLKAAYLASCINLSNALQNPGSYEFRGLKSFMGVPAYALGNQRDGSEEYFDTKTFFHLGTLGAQGSFTRSSFGYRDFGGTVLPQFTLFHQGNRIELRSLEAVQWDVSPAVSGDLYQLTLGQVAGNYTSVMPLLVDGMTQNQLATEQDRATQEAAAVRVDASYQHGLDPTEQPKRRAYLRGAMANLPSVSQMHEQWAAIGSAVMGSIEQHERARRFSNPTGSDDIYFNWRDVTNVNWLMHRKSIQVKKKTATSGENATLSYCALDDKGDLRHEDNGSIEVENLKGDATFNEGSSPEIREFSRFVNPTPVMRRSLEICLLGDTIRIYDQLAQSRFGTGTFNKRDAYVIVLGDNRDGQYYFFDKETFLLIGKQSGAQDKAPESFYDLKPVGEAILPFKRYTFENDEHTADTVDSLESVEFDLAVNDSEFSLNPPVVRSLHSITLSEKRPSLVERAQQPSVFGALLTGTLMGLAGGGANSPILQAGNRQAEQIRELGNQLASRQAMVGRSTANLSLMNMPKFSAPSGAFGAGAFFDPGLQSANLAQLQSLLGLTQANQSGNEPNSELLQVLQQLTAQSSQALPGGAVSGRSVGAVGTASQRASTVATVAETCPHEGYPDMGAHCNPVKNLNQCVSVGKSDWPGNPPPDQVAWLTVNFQNRCDQPIRLQAASADPQTHFGELANLQPHGTYTYVNQQHTNRYSYSADDGVDCSVNNARPGCAIPR
jgi:hypothetical protein